MAVLREILVISFVLRLHYLPVLSDLLLHYQLLSIDCSSSVDDSMSEKIQICRRNGDRQNDLCKIGVAITCKSAAADDSIVTYVIA